MQIYSMNVTFQSSEYLLECVLFIGSQTARLASGKLFLTLFVNNDPCSLFLFPHGCKKVILNNKLYLVYILCRLFRK